MDSRPSYSLRLLSIIISSYLVASLGSTVSSSHVKTNGSTEDPTFIAQSTLKKTGQKRISYRGLNLTICEPTKAFHNETQKCYYHAGAPSVPISLVKASSPCGELMYFYLKSLSSPYGVCDCINDDGCKFYADFHRPVLNWPGSNRCYYAYEQGPCKRGEWIVMNKKSFQSECRPNPCLGKKLESIPSNMLGAFEKPDVDIFWFVKNGTCYQTLTQAYCKPDEYVRFVRTFPVPICVGRNFGQGCGSIGTTATLPCPQGHKRVGDDCTPVVDIQ
ncbi:unnamed protein product [Orchesella dallaii]|uniref:DUF4789 domain-containing protein n=1 Tax=Orchesella dallaii TaxID=48710 RepID=A0ABP1QVY6_9HEXA